MSETCLNCGHTRNSHYVDKLCFAFFPKQKMAPCDCKKYSSGLLPMSPEEKQYFQDGYVKGYERALDNISTAKEPQEEAFEDISIERENQDIKWGDQSHLENFWWLTILAEEFGEVAKDSNQEKDDALYEELTQVAAVAVAWMEALNKKKL